MTMGYLGYNFIGGPPQRNPPVPPVGVRSIVNRRQDSFEMASRHGEDRGLMVAQPAPLVGHNAGPSSVHAS